MKCTGTTSMYNSDGREASKWVREPVKALKGSDAPQLSSGLALRDSGVGVAGSFGFYVNESNVVMQSGQFVFFLSSAYSRGYRNGGAVLSPENWNRVIALYAARKLVGRTWINDKDEYLVPLGSLL